MAKGSNEEQRCITRESLFEALMILSDQKPYDKITVTELVERAGVSRMAFYRNYESIDEIIRNRLQELNDDYLAMLERHSAMRIEDFAFLFFEYMQANADFMRKVFDIGYSWVLRDLINDYMRSWETIPLSNIDASKFQNQNLRWFIAGGYVNIVEKWLSGGMAKSSEEIGKDVATFVKRLMLES